MVIRRKPSDFLVDERLTPKTLGAVLSGAPGGADDDSDPDAADRATEDTEPSAEAEPLADTPGRSFAIYRLTKASLTTPEAAGRLARALNLKPSRIGHAGLKDKHAVTTQYFSVAHDRASADLLPQSVSAPLRDGPGPQADPRLDPMLEPAAPAGGWSAERVGTFHRHLRAADIGHNRFTIIVRAMTAEQCRQMNLRADHLAFSPAPDPERGPAPRTGPSLLLVNYFGDQRFVSARHGAGFAATRLIADDFEGALKLLIATPARKDSGAFRDLTRACANHWGDWKKILRLTRPNPERKAVETLASGGTFSDAFAALPYLTQQMCVESFQSWLWNATARSLIGSLPQAQMLTAEDDFGTMLFVSPGAVPPQLRSLRIPMLASTTTPDPAWWPAAKRTLDELHLRLDMLRVPNLRRPSFSGSPRPLFVEASDCSITPSVRDEFASATSPANRRRTLQFSLPRGAYATTLLRALGC